MSGSMNSRFYHNNVTNISLPDGTTCSKNLNRVIINVGQHVGRSETSPALLVWPTQFSPESQLVVGRKVVDCKCYRLQHASPQTCRIIEIKSEAFAANGKMKYPKSCRIRRIQIIFELLKNLMNILINYSMNIFPKNKFSHIRAPNFDTAVFCAVFLALLNMLKMYLNDFSS